MWRPFRSLLSWFWRNDRQLFRYWDGKKNRAIDPLLAWRQIWMIGDYARDCQIAGRRNDDGSPFYPIDQVREAEDSLRERARTIFGVKEWSESQGGLTWDETDELLNEFMGFIADLKKKRETSQTSSAPSTSMERSASPDTDACHDGAPSALPSTPNESTADALSGP